LTSGPKYIGGAVITKISVESRLIVGDGFEEKCCAEMEVDFAMVDYYTARESDCHDRSRYGKYLGCRIVGGNKHFDNSNIGMVCNKFIVLSLLCFFGSVRHYDAITQTQSVDVIIRRELVLFSVANDELKVHEDLASLPGVESLLDHGHPLSETDDGDLVFSKYSLADEDVELSDNGLAILVDLLERDVSNMHQEDDGANPRVTDDDFVINFTTSAFDYVTAFLRSDREKSDVNAFYCGDTDGFDSKQVLQGESEKEKACILASYASKHSEYSVQREFKEMKVVATEVEGEAYEVICCGVEYRLVVRHRSEKKFTVLDKFYICREERMEVDFFCSVAKETGCAISENGIAFESARQILGSGSGGSNTVTWLSGTAFNDREGGDGGRDSSGDFTRKGKDKKKKRQQKHAPKQDGYAKGREFSMGR
jgi:hypothetical protein